MDGIRVFWVLIYRSFSTKNPEANNRSKENIQEPWAFKFLCTSMKPLGSLSVFFLLQNFFSTSTMPGLSGLRSEFSSKSTRGALSGIKQDIQWQTLKGKRFSNTQSCSKQVTLILWNRKFQNLDKCEALTMRPDSSKHTLEQALNWRLRFCHRRMVKTDSWHFPTCLASCRCSSCLQ